MSQSYADHGQFLDLWQALAQVVPHVESPDTLGTIIATALHELIGTGRSAVILRANPVSQDLESDDLPITYFMRLVGQSVQPNRPIYLNGEVGVLAKLPHLKGPFRVATPWPADYDPTRDRLLQLAETSLVLAPIPGSGPQPEWPAQGAICLLDVPRERLPTPVELISLASYTGLALNLLDSKSQATRQSVEYSIVSEIGRSLTSSLSLDDIFNQILSNVRATIDASGVSVGLIDEESQEIVFENSLMGPKFTDLPPIRLKWGQGVAGWVAQYGEPLNVPDAYADPRFYPDVDAASGFVTRSILCVPLKVEGEVIGVMEAVNKRSGHFTNADQRLLSALSSSVAIAIEKARLHADVLSEKRRMEAIFSNMSEGLLTVDLAGRIVAVNPALQAMVSRNEVDLADKLCFEAITTEPETLQNLYQQIISAENESRSFHAACDLVRPDGARTPVLVSGAANRDPANDISDIVIVFSDMSQISEVERMKEDFIANVTHELRTPLATILLYARLLRAGKAKGDPKREARYLKIVEEQSNQLQQLVRQILELARVKATFSFSGQEHILLNTLFEELLPPLRKLAQHKGLDIRVDVPAGLPPVIASHEGLRLVFKNLVDNAIKFSSKGYIRIAARQQDDKMWVDVADQGMGIAPELLPHLFQRFYRTQAAVERGIGGTGLGLALVKTAVEELGGSISVESEIDKGSIFTVVLPIPQQQ